MTDEPKPWEIAMEAYLRANPHREEEVEQAFAPPEPSPVEPEPEPAPVAEPLFDPALSSAGAQTGMALASQADRVQEWKIAASAWLDGQPTGTRFTADDVTAAVGLPDEGPNRNNVVGAWVNAQATRGHVRFSGRYRKSTRVDRHTGVQREWIVV